MQKSTTKNKKVDKKKFNSKKLLDTVELLTKMKGGHKTNIVILLYKSEESLTIDEITLKMHKDSYFSDSRKKLRNKTSKEVSFLESHGILKKKKRKENKRFQYVELSLKMKNLLEKIA